MKKIIIYTLSISLFITGCINKENEKKKIESEDTQIKEEILLDSITEKRYQLKENLLISYSKLSFAFGMKDKIDYSEYEEFKMFDSLVRVYKECKLSNRENDLLIILQSKKSLILNKHNEAVKLLKMIPEDSDFDNYKSILLAINYKLDNNSEEANKIFDEMLNDFNKDNKGDIDCFRYFLTKVLAENDSENSICLDKLNYYNKLKKTPYVEIIRNNFLAQNEL